MENTIARDPNAAQVGALVISGSSGKWAGEQFIRALERNEIPKAQHLRAAGVLREHEWIEYDRVVVEESVRRLRAVGDLKAFGLTKTLTGGFGKTVLQYNKISDMAPAGVSMTGMAKTEDDTVVYDPSSLPLPIIHKDFKIDMRTLAASRNGGEALDTVNARVASRKVTEMSENLLINGGPQFGSLNIYGYTTHPDRNTGNFGTGGAWTGAKTGAEILADVLTMMGALQADGFYGPYGLYVPAGSDVILDNDFKAASDTTIRGRLRQIESIKSIQASDMLAAGNVIMVQLTSDVVELVESEPLQTIQWDIDGGMMIGFKVMVIEIPLIRSTMLENSGIYHMHT